MQEKGNVCLGSHIWKLLEGERMHYVITHSIQLRYIALEKINVDYAERPSNFVRTRKAIINNCPPMALLYATFGRLIIRFF